MGWTRGAPWLACVWLTACAGGSRQRDLRLDTETVGRARYAAALARQVAASGAAQASMSPLVQAIPPALLALMQNHSADALEERLAECAIQAESDGNARFFEGRPPTRQECAEVVGRDRCGQPVTRAMQLGKQKHVLALECAEKALKELWPAPFSIEQRYRYYPNAHMVESISKSKEAELIAQGCTDELRGTLKPDIVLHADRQSLLRSVLTLDFKFPCPDTNRPQWTPYSSGSPHAGKNQGDVYQEALGGPALLISPNTGVWSP
jgi:hypothetical protein